MGIIERVIGEEERTAERNSPAAEQEEISFLDLLVVIARRRWSIINITIGFALIAALISLFLPKRYTATTSILPPQQNTSSGAALMAQLGSLSSVASLSGGSLGLKNPNDLQVAMLKSRTVEDAMLDRFHLLDLYHVKIRSTARKQLESVVTIDGSSKDGLIRISVIDHDPRRAAEFANAYVEEYKRLSATLAISEASQRRLFFEQQLGQAKDNLANAEEQLKKTEQKTGLIQIDSQVRAVVASVAQLRAEIAAKEVQIRGMQSFATPENPDLRMAEEQLAGLRAQEEKMGAASGDTSDALPITKGNMQQSSLEYVRKLRDVKYYETIFDLLARQYEAAKVDEAREGAVVQVVDRAVVPDSKSSPKRTLIVLGAGGFGLFVGLIWVFAAEGITRLSNNPMERPRLEALRLAFSRRKPR